VAYAPPAFVAPTTFEPPAAFIPPAAFAPPTAFAPDPPPARFAEPSVSQPTSGMASNTNASDEYTCPCKVAGALERVIA
jgi:hypothetical protein